MNVYSMIVVLALALVQLGPSNPSTFECGGVTYTFKDKPEIFLCSLKEGGSPQTAKFVEGWNLYEVSLDLNIDGYAIYGVESKADHHCFTRMGNNLYPIKTRRVVSSTYRGHISVFCIGERGAYFEFYK